MIHTPRAGLPSGPAPHTAWPGPASAPPAAEAAPVRTADVLPEPFFGVLGQLSVRGTTLSVTSPVRRAVLTACLLRFGQPIGIAEFSEILWDEPPVSATANLRSHVTGLRRDLDEVEPGLGERVRTYRGGQCGYGLEIAAEEFDLPHFTAAVQRGRNWLLAGSHEAAVGALEQAVGLWRGPFGQDLPPTRWFNAHIAGLNNIRFDAYQDLFTASVLAGRTSMLAYRIESVIAEAPYRQHLWELLAAVHCLHGDAVGTLSVVKRCQRLFAEDLGLDLPPGIEAMRSAALNWDREEALRLVASRAQVAAERCQCRRPPRTLPS
ncbi:BTAD domain-containing putative transcriptional regulator [Streptomyces sp. ADI96-02]|uniref:AfsR/SARP family transcriptional regulator n=1 Tax=Streptomyces sp. ADI96-02 TaxID=1522760 RepID=UPI001F14AB53|nr:BTAD domain-containing putative transcriptional regulator [Streptomyces sp. ADI96-02]